MLEGAGIGASRYLLNGSKVLGIFIQTDDDAIHGRVFMDDVWEADFYSMDLTDSSLPPNAALTATTLLSPPVDEQRNRRYPKELLAWVNSCGFVNVQNQETASMSTYTAFGAPNELVDGDEMGPGLAASGGQGLGREWERGFGVGIGRVTTLLVFDILLPRRGEGGE